MKNCCMWHNVALADVRGGSFVWALVVTCQIKPFNLWTLQTASPGRRMTSGIYLVILCKDEQFMNVLMYCVSDQYNDCKLF